MTQYLITQTLLSAWGYMFDCAEGLEDSARESFLQTLQRTKQEQTEAMRKGLAFESLCYSIADGSFEPDSSGYPNGYEGARKIADIIRGAPTQVRAEREITVDGMEFVVYGILDALKAGTIYDIKFKCKSLGSIDLAGGWLNSPQHPAYFYIMPEATDFRYLVSDGNDLYIESYQRAEAPFIGDIIHDFIRSIHGLGLLDVYTHYWDVQRSKVYGKTTQEL